MKKIIASLLMFLTWAAYAESTRFVIGYGPGGTNNIIRILVGDAEQAGLQQPVVDNRPGANGQVALKAYLQELPSSSSYLGVTGGQILFEPLVNPENNFLQDLRIIGPVVTSPLALATTKKSSIRRIADLFDRRIPSQRINIAVAGESHQMFVNLVAQYSHHDIQAVRFKGSNDGYAALLGGHVDLQADVLGFFTPFRSEINILAVGSQSQLGVPSILSFAPKAEMNNFFAIAVNQQVTNTGQVEHFLTKGMIDSNRRNQLESQGYQVDWNRRSDYMIRAVVPAFERWKKLSNKGEKHDN